MAQINYDLIESIEYFQRYEYNHQWAMIYHKRKLKRQCLEILIYKIL